MLLFKETYNNQAQSVKQDLDNKLYEIVGTLHKEGFQSERFDRISDFASQISIIPISKNWRRYYRSNSYASWSCSRIFNRATSNS